MGSEWPCKITRERTSAGSILQKAGICCSTSAGNPSPTTLHIECSRSDAARVMGPPLCCSFSSLIGRSSTTRQLAAQAFITSTRLSTKSRYGVPGGGGGVRWRDSGRTASWQQPTQARRAVVAPAPVDGEPFLACVGIEAQVEVVLPGLQEHISPVCVGCVGGSGQWRPTRAAQAVVYAARPAPGWGDRRRQRRRRR